MKKRFLVFAVFFVSFVALTSCVSTGEPIVFDETLPDEAMVTIHWAGNYVRPVAYNGISVDWRLRSTNTPIRIPAGNTTFEIAGSSVVLGGTFRQSWNWEGFYFSFYFERGRSYTITIPAGSVDIHEGLSVARRTLITSFSPEWN